jgi:hypothetical protein
LNTTFTGRDNVNGTTTDVHVFHNGSALFNGVVNGFGPGSGPSFATSLTVLPGDTIDFAVGMGSNGSYISDPTGLDATIMVSASDLCGDALKISRSYEFSVERSNSKTDAIQLFNPGTAPRSATLEILNPHSGLTISLTSPISIAAGETKTLPIAINPGSLPIGKYDGLLLKVAVDDGSTLYSNITVNVTAPGAADLPDLTVSAADISVINTAPGDPVTYVATIRNRGNAPASNVTVQFSDFGVLLENQPPVIPVVPANGSTTTSITVPASPAGDRLVEVVIDPSGAVPELDKTNNQASQIFPPQGSSGPPAGNILVTGSLPPRVCVESLFTVSGQAVYDITVNGVRNTDYVVKGGAVQVAVGGDDVYGDIHTDINGTFSRFLFAPASPGTYPVSMTVTDTTFRGTGQFDFEAVECPDPDLPPPPLCPPDCPPGPIDGGDGAWVFDAIRRLWEWICSGGNCPPVPAQDLFVYSENILFANNHPNPHEDVRIAAQIQYFATRTDLVAEQVPVTFSVTTPGSSKVTLSQTTIDRMRVGGSMVFANWQAPANGIYLVEVEIGPSSVQENPLNNAATRAIIVGPYASGQGVIAGQVTDASGGVGGVAVRVLAAGGTIGSTFTDATGFYLVEHVNVGDYQVQISVPSDYRADAETKTVTVSDQSVSTVNFSLTKQVGDTTPPVITPTVNGTLGSNGWYTSNVTVSWAVVDGESSVTAQTGCATTSVTTDTAGVTLTCSATSSGGTASNSVTIRRDTTPPTITGSASPAANTNGWRNSAVTVSFTCTDATAGIASCTAPQTLGEGANQAGNGTATDNAGNSATTQVTGIHVDLTVPVVSVTGVTSGATYTLGSVPVAGCMTTDALSGVQTSAMLSVTGGNASGVGTFTARCTGATDKAGNTGAASVTYQVIYPFTGFFQPVDNPPAVNAIRAGAAAPIKFSLGGNRGLAILAAGSPTSQAMACGGGGTNDIAETVTAGNSSLSYDPITDQYIYVWKTNKAWASTCRQFTLTLNDGTVHQAYFQFK